MLKFNILTDNLPTRILIEGIDYEINADFRTSIKLEGIINQKTSDADKVKELLSLYYPVIPKNIGAAIDQALWFYRCGKAEKKKEEKRIRYRQQKKSVAYHFEQDAGYIYAAFLEQYKIDLSQIEFLHWWKFMSMFNSLNDNVQMSKIMYYRMASLSGLPKEKRAYLNEMKKLYEIKEEDAENKLNLVSRNEKWKSYIKNRAQEVRGEQLLK